MRREVFILTLLVLGGVALLVVLGIATRGGEDTAGRPASTYNPGAKGAAAVYEYLENVDVPVARVLTRDLQAAPGDVLFIVAPEGLTELDADALEPRIEDGLRVVVADDGPNALLSSLGINEADDRGEDLPVPVAFPSRTVRGVGYVELSHRRRLTPPARWTPVVADDAGAAVLVRTLGKGRIVVVADSFPFTNTGVSQADNLTLLHNLAALRAPEGRVVFDEFHHGYTRARTPTTYLFDSGFGAMFYLVLVLGALWAWSALTRLGPPVPLDQAPRRTSAEYVDSLAGVLEAGDAPGYALRALVADLRHRAAEVCGVPMGAPAERLFQTLQRSRPEDAAVVYQATSRAESALARGDISGAELYELALHIDDARSRLDTLRTQTMRRKL